MRRLARCHAGSGRAGVWLSWSICRAGSFGPRVTMWRRLGSLFEKVFVMAITRSPQHRIFGSGGFGRAKPTQGVRLVTLRSVALLVVGLLLALGACGGRPVVGCRCPESDRRLLRRARRRPAQRRQSRRRSRRRSRREFRLVRQCRSRRQFRRSGRRRLHRRGSYTGRIGRRGWAGGAAVRQSCPAPPGRPRATRSLFRRGPRRSREKTRGTNRYCSGLSGRGRNGGDRGACIEKQRQSGRRYIS
jgi:hypothetical protein